MNDDACDKNCLGCPGCSLSNQETAPCVHGALCEKCPAPVETPDEEPAS